MMIAAINEIVEKVYKSGSGTYINKFDIAIKYDDIESLNGVNWLNDHIIDFFFLMIQQRSTNVYFGHLPKVHVFSSHFYTKLKQTTEYEAIKKWYGLNEVDIFSKELILFPIHNALHWSLVIVNCKNRTLSYLDSMNGGYVNAKGDQHMKRILTLLEQDHSFKKKKSLSAGWRINPPGIWDFAPAGVTDFRIPQQENGYDCGVFTCLFAEYASRKVDNFDFNQIDIPFFRIRIMAEILNGVLYGY